MQKLTKDTELKVGDILVSGKSKKKVLAICGNLVASSAWGNFVEFGAWLTWEQMVSYNYDLEVPEWVPKSNEDFFFIDSRGTVAINYWQHTYEGATKFRITTKNYYKTKEDAQKALDKILCIQ